MKQDFAFGDQRVLRWPQTGYEPVRSSFQTMAVSVTAGST